MAALRRTDPKSMRVPGAEECRSSRPEYYRRRGGPAPSDPTPCPPQSPVLSPLIFPPCLPAPATPSTPMRPAVPRLVGRAPRSGAALRARREPAARARPAPDRLGLPPAALVGSDPLPADPRSRPTSAGACTPPTAPRTPCRPSRTCCGLSGGAGRRWGSELHGFRAELIHAAAGGHRGRRFCRPVRGQGVAYGAVRITVVDRTNYHLFQPMLYQVATAALDTSDIASPIRSILRHQRNTEVLMADVTAVDAAARRFEPGRRASWPTTISCSRPGPSFRTSAHAAWEAVGPADSRRRTTPRTSGGGCCWRSRRRNGSRTSKSARPADVRGDRRRPDRRRGRGRTRRNPPVRAPAGLPPHRPAGRHRHAARGRAPAPAQLPR